MYKFANEAVLATEVGASVSAAGLMLVFLPLLITRLREMRGELPVWVTDRFRWAVRIVALLVSVPATAATLGLLTLWNVAELSVATGYLTLATVWIVMATGVLSTWALTVRR